MGLVIPGPGQGPGQGISHVTPHNTRYKLHHAGLGSITSSSIPQSPKRVILAAAARESVDFTLPGRRPPIGHLHPITQTIEEICAIFSSMGFQRN